MKWSDHSTIMIELAVLLLVLVIFLFGLWRSYRVLRLSPRVFITGIILALIMLFSTVQKVFRVLITYCSNIFRLYSGTPPTDPIDTLFDSPVFWIGIIKIFLALASVFSIISYLSPKTGPGGETTDSNAVLVQNFFTILFVLAAVYFSIASMIAVPLVKGDGVQADLRYMDSLEVDLDSVSNTDGHLHHDYMATLDSISMEEEVNPEKYQLMELIKDRAKREVSLIFKELIPDMKMQALSQMKSSDEANLVNSLKLKENTQLLEWYQLNRRQMIVYLNEEIREVKEFTFTAYISDKPYEVLLAEFNALPNQLSAISPLPQAPRQGDYLGVFNVAMRWLLEIESYPLVMIFGMAGFGLLGAASGAFIKEGMRRKEKGGPLVEDLPGVMIKGFTASMVVFLGIQGSMGILGGGSSDQLDSNLLFFLALVAAVYSDKAWEWAGAKFEETLAKDKDAAEDVEPAEPSLAAGPLPPTGPPSLTPDHEDNPFAPPSAPAPPTRLPTPATAKPEEDEAPWMTGMFSTAGANTPHPPEEDDAPPDFLA